MLFNCEDISPRIGTTIGNSSLTKLRRRSEKRWNQFHFEKTHDTAQSLNPSHHWNGICSELAFVPHRSRSVAKQARIRRNLPNRMSVSHHLYAASILMKSPTCGFCSKSITWSLWPITLCMWALNWFTFLIRSSVNSEKSRDDSEVPTFRRRYSKSATSLREVPEQDAHQEYLCASGPSYLCPTTFSGSPGAPTTKENLLTIKHECP